MSRLRVRYPFTCYVRISRRWSIRTMLCRMANERPIPTAKHGDSPNQGQVAMRSSRPITINFYTVVKELEELGAVEILSGWKTRRCRKSRAQEGWKYGGTGAVKNKDVMNADIPGFFTSYASKKRCLQELAPIDADHHRGAGNDCRAFAYDDGQNRRFSKPDISTMYYLKNSLSLAKRFTNSMMLNKSSFFP